MIKPGRIFAVCALFAFAACGGSHSVVPQHANSGFATFVVKIPFPLAVSGAVRPQYVSAGTKAIGIRTLVQTLAANVTPGSPNCVTSASATTCTFQNVGIPVGQSSVEVDAYDQTLSASGLLQGKILSSGATLATIAEGTSNTVHVAMGGVVAKAQILSLDTTPVNGSPTDLHFSLNIMDADGYTIVGSDPYAFAGDAPTTNSVGVSMQSISTVVPDVGAYDFTFTVNGKSSTGSMTLAAPSDTYAMSYSGRGVISATLAVQVNGAPPLATATIAPVPASIPLAGGLAVDSSAQVYALDDKTVWFSEPSKKSLAYIASGSLHEIPLPSGHTPTSLNPVSSTSMVFATREGTVGVVDASGSVAEYTLPVSVRIGGVAFDDLTGDIVFTEPDAGKVATYNRTPPGYYTEYALPAGATPGTMSFNGYWVDPGTNAVGDLNVAQATVHEFPLPTPNSDPTSVFSGNSSAMWITEGNAKRVAVLNPNSGALVAEYPTADILTSISETDEGRVIAATDVSGNIEYFNPNDTSGRETTFVTGVNGPAQAISGAFQREGFVYLCPTCLNGLQEFLF